ncbi:MAG: inositol monophosphatase family protein [Alphaproteobacteria bacterium]
MNTPRAPEFVALAQAMADTARTMLMEHFRGEFSSTIKDDASPVSELDPAVERRLRDMIAEQRPGDGCIGEEFPDHQADAEFVWAIDPIDGTKAFVTGTPVFGTLIGLRHGPRYVLGLVDHSAAGDRWLGVVGDGATRNGVPIHTRPCASLDTAICTASGPGVIAREHWLKIRPLQRACRWTIFGADISDYGSISSGFQDLIVDAQLGEDDWAAGAALIEAAGGRVTDWQGNTLTPDSDGTILAVGDPALLEPALAVLNGSS